MPKAGVSTINNPIAGTAFGVALAAVALASDMETNRAFWTSAQEQIRTDTDANGNSQQGDFFFEFRLPRTYVAGSDLTLKATSFVSAVCNTSATLDFSVYEKGSDGVATGSDLNGTAAQTINSGTPAVKSFTIDGSGLSAGDVILVAGRLVADDTGGSAAARAIVSDISIETTAQGGF